MKNLLKLVLLVALFISSSSDAFSQTITNNTDCDFRVKVHYSYPAACDNQDDLNWNVPANAVGFAIPGPAGSRATGAKGRPVFFSTSSNNCGFAITLCGGPDDDTVACSAPCLTGPSYTATIDSNGNITIF
ncbi:MAG: hypothetical protein AB8H03_23850 [Saprospiraceae bacterium]